MPLTELTLGQIHPVSHSPLVPAPTKKRENKRQEKGRECVTDYYPPSPVYMVSYEEDTQNLVDNLVSEPTPKEKRNTKQDGERAQTTGR